MFKANVVERHNHTQTFNILIIVLPDAHDGLYGIAQSPALVFPQNRDGDVILFACLIDCHTLLHPLNKNVGILPLDAYILVCNVQNVQCLYFIAGHTFSAFLNMVKETRCRCGITLVFLPD